MVRKDIYRLYNFMNESLRAINFLYVQYSGISFRVEEKFGKFGVKGITKFSLCFEFADETFS